MKFWKPGTMPAGSPVSRMATRSARAALSPREVGEHPRVQRRQQPGQLRMLDVLEKLLVLGGRQRVPAVLVAHRHDDLVEQRVAQA